MITDSTALKNFHDNTTSLGLQRLRLQDGQLAELSIVNCESGESTVIYETAELIEAPNWTPDGEWLIFNADSRIFRISPDGKRGPERINTEPIEDLNNDPALFPQKTESLHPPGIRKPLLRKRTTP